MTLGHDLRASIFSRIVFVRANLQDADLRQSSFLDCDFTGAIMRGAKLTRKQCECITLSEIQRQEIDWRDDDGEPPAGG